MPSDYDLALKLQRDFDAELAAVADNFVGDLEVYRI